MSSDIQIVDPESNEVLYTFKKDEINAYQEKILELEALEISFKVIYPNIFDDLLNLLGKDKPSAVQCYYASLEEEIDHHD